MYINTAINIFYRHLEPGFPVLSAPGGRQWLSHSRSQVLPTPGTSLLRLGFSSSPVALSVTKTQASVWRRGEEGSAAELGCGAALIIHAVAPGLAEGGLNVKGLKHWVTVCSVTQLSDIGVTVQITESHCKLSPSERVVLQRMCQVFARLKGKLQRFFIKTIQRVSR